MSDKDNILDEVIKASGVKQKKGEEPQEFQIRIVKKLGSLEDDEFDALSKEARDWHDKAVDAINDESGELDFPLLGDADADDEDGDAESEEEESEEAPKKAAKSKGKASKKKAGKDKPKAEKKRGKSSSRRLKEIMVANPDIKKDKLREKLEADGFSMTDSSLQAYFSDFRQTLDVLRDAGKL